MQDFNDKFPGFAEPSIPFERVRDQLRANLFYYDVDLTNARSIAAATDITLPLAGNSFFVDQDLTNGGNATVYFQDVVSAGVAPVYVGPGFIAKVPFTQLRIENAAQSGKRLRIFYGVDIDFVPGINPTVSLTSAVPPRCTATMTKKTVNSADTQIVAANPSRTYLAIMNRDAALNTAFTLGSGAAVFADGWLLAANGGFWIAESNIITSEIRGITSGGNNANIIVIEG